MDIVMVRHGSTDINHQGRYGGSTDSKLSVKGVEEILKLENMFELDNFDAIFSSPLMRCTSSAELICQENRSYIIDNRLAESSFGIFEGLNHQEILERYPLEYEKWNADYYNYKIPCGESLREVFTRCDDFISEASEKYKRVLVFTHGGIIRAALSSALGGHEFFYKFKIDNASISTISKEYGYWFIKGANVFGKTF